MRRGKVKRWLIMRRTGPEQTVSRCHFHQVPATWAKRAWPSLRPLGSWLTDFTSRLTQLEEWQNNPTEVIETLGTKRMEVPVCFASLFEEC